MQINLESRRLQASSFFSIFHVKQSVNGVAIGDVQHFIKQAETLLAAVPANCHS